MNVMCQLVVLRKVVHFDMQAVQIDLLVVDRIPSANSHGDERMWQVLHKERVQAEDHLIFEGSEEAARATPQSLEELHL